MKKKELVVHLIILRMIKTFTREEKKIEVVNSKRYSMPENLAPSFSSLCLIRAVAHTYMSTSNRKVNDVPVEYGTVLN